MDPAARPFHHALPLAALLLLSLCGCDKLSKAPPPPPPPTVVEVITAATQDVSTTGEWIGTTAGVVDTQIRARVSGYLVSQNYKEGGAVKVGDLLFTVDARPFEVTLDTAKAELARATADVARSAAELARAQAAQGKAELDEKRLAPLVPSGAVSQEDYDNAIQGNLAAKAGVKAAEAAAKAAEAGVQAARASIAQAELNLSYTKVTSRVDGIAGIARAQLGDLVGGTSPHPLTTVSTIDPIKVYFPISEQEYLRAAANLAKAAERTAEARKRHPLELILSDGSVFPSVGEFLLADRQVDPSTGTIRLAAQFANPGNVLRPGQFARVRAVTQTDKAAVVVPQRAVAEMQGTYLISVVEDDNTVSVRPVTVGVRTGSNWVITKGIEAGDSVIVEGAQKVRAGMTVSPKPWQPAKDAKAAKPKGVGKGVGKKPAAADNAGEDAKAKPDRGNE